VLKNVPKSEGFLHCYYCPYLSLIIWGNFQPYIWIDIYLILRYLCYESDILYCATSGIASTFLVLILDAATVYE